MQYDEDHSLSNGMTIVKQGNKFGLIDELGNEVLPILFDELYTIAVGLFIASYKCKKHLYSVNKGLVYSDIEDVEENYNPFGFNPEYYWIKKEGKWGLFNDSFKQIIPFRLEYDSCELITFLPSNNYYIKVTKDGKSGLINGLLNIVVIDLEDDIEDIILTQNNTFKVIKKDDQRIGLSSEDLNHIIIRASSKN